MEKIKFLPVHRACSISLVTRGLVLRITIKCHGGFLDLECSGKRKARVGKGKDIEFREGKTPKNHVSVTH